MKFRTTLASVALCTTLVACNNSTSEPQEVVTPKLVGVFGSVPVSGVSYSTPTGSGTTDSLGQFEYAAGETVSFLIGSLVLGETAGASSITEFDLVPGAHMPEDALDLNRLITGAPERGGFSTALNMISLLQTLDNDSDVANGIAIDAGVEAEFGRYFVDLHQFYKNFDQHRPLLRELYTASARGELTARPIVNPGRALYAIGGPSAELSARITHIRTGEGSVDQQINYSFNVIGKKTHSTVDNELDGTANRIDSYEFDSTGNETRHDADYYGTGFINRTIVTEYNEFGDEVSRVRFNADGDQTRTYLTEWSEDGRMLTKTVQRIFNDSTEYWHYNDNEVTYEKDTGSDGTINEVHQLVLNDRGDILETLIDRGADGVFDEKITREFSSLGLETLKQVDTNNDGIVEYESTCTYTPTGLELECVRQDEGVNYRVVRTYENDRITVYDYDGDNDGEFEFRTTLVYNSNGQMERVEQDRDFDGSINYIGTSTFNDEGQLIREDRDNDADGAVNFFAEYAYEGARNVSYVSDYNGDGTLEISSSYSDWVSVESSIVE